MWIGHITNYLEPELHFFPLGEKIHEFSSLLYNIRNENVLFGAKTYYGHLDFRDAFNRPKNGIYDLIGSG